MTPVRKDPATGYWRSDAEDPALYLQPVHLIEQGAQRETILALVQESTTLVLNEVANGWSSRGMLSYRWRRRLARRTDGVAQLAGALRVKGICGADALGGAPQDPASQTVACIQFAREVASRLGTPLRDTVVTPARLGTTDGTLSACPDSLCDRLVDLGSRSEGAVEGLYLHGSVALGDTTGFSDLDGAVLLAPGSEQDPRALTHAAHGITASVRLLLARDALQHHGWMVLAPFLLDAYPEHLLPVEAFSEGTAVFGPNELLFRVFHSEVVARRRLWSMVQVFRRLRWEKEARTRRGLHEDKMLLSQFMLLPALYTQATGRYISKRRSFRAVRDECPDLTWDIMDEVTALRTRWTQPDFGRFWGALATVTGPWEAQAAWRRLSRSSRRGDEVLRIRTDWIDRMAKLAESLLATAESRSGEGGSS
jgi:hypothetical protein